MRVLRAGDYTRMPWKNGGGETVEMLVSPEGASLDAFDWRISMARVAAPGPFSSFHGVDRTVSIIAGQGIDLVFDDRRVTLNCDSAPFRFAGDVRVDSVLNDGAIDDLNVMTRRERCDHRVTRHVLNGPTTLAWSGDIGVVVATGGSVDVRIGDATMALAAADVLGLSDGDAREFEVTPRGAVDVFVIEITSQADEPVFRDACL